MGWFLYGMDLRHDRVKNLKPIWKKRENSLSLCTSINPFYATGLFSYPLKTSEIQRIYVLRGYQKTTMAWNMLIHFYAGIEIF